MKEWPQHSTGMQTPACIRHSIKTRRLMMRHARISSIASVALTYSRPANRETGPTPVSSSPASSSRRITSMRKSPSKRIAPITLPYNSSDWKPMRKSRSESDVIAKRSRGMTMFFSVFSNRSCRRLTAYTPRSPEGSKTDGVILRIASAYCF